MATCAKEELESRTARVRNKEGEIHSWDKKNSIGCVDETGKRMMKVEAGH